MKTISPKNTRAVECLSGKATNAYPEKSPTAKCLSRKATNANPEESPTAKCLSGKATNCEMLIRKSHQLRNAYPEESPTSKCLSGKATNGEMLIWKIHQKRSVFFSENPPTAVHFHWSWWFVGIKHFAVGRFFDLALRSLRIFIGRGQKVRVRTVYWIDFINNP